MHALALPHLTRPHLTRPHLVVPVVPRDADHLLAMTTFVLGSLGLVLLAASAPPVLGAWCGVVGLVTGLWGQLVSRTRNERFFDVTGAGMAAVALMVGASLGGLV